MAIIGRSANDLVRPVFTAYCCMPTSSKNIVLLWNTFTLSNTRISTNVCYTDLFNRFVRVQTQYKQGRPPLRVSVNNGNRTNGRYLFVSPIVCRANLFTLGSTLKQDKYELHKVSSMEGGLNRFQHGHRPPPIRHQELFIHERDGG